MEKKKILSIGLALMLFLSIVPIEIYAQEDSRLAMQVLYLETNSDLEDFAKEIKNMSDEELQSVINYAQIYSTSRNNQKMFDTSMIHNQEMLAPSSIYNQEVLVLKGAWLAAAQVARSKGYSLSATLVEHSVWNNDYSEINGQFSSSIKRTNEYDNVFTSTVKNWAYLNQIMWVLTPIKIEITFDV